LERQCPRHGLRVLPLKDVPHGTASGVKLAPHTVSGIISPTTKNQREGRCH
jgi:hypothetical protein